LVVIDDTTGFDCYDMLLGHVGLLGLAT